MGHCSPPSVAGLIRGCPLNPVFLWVFLPSSRSGEALAATWFLFEVFLLLERWPAKVVESPLPGPGMAIQHLLHPADALSCPLSLAAVASPRWCCQLVDVSVLSPRQPGSSARVCLGVDISARKSFCMTSSAVAAIGTFLVLIRLLHRWVIQIRPCRFSVGASRYPITPAATRRRCIGLAVDRLCAGRERLMHNALLFAMMRAAC